MYTICLHCLNTLGEERPIEGLPAGRRFAFDPARGRLWVVCEACGRWNLVPSHDRGAALAAAERLWEECARKAERAGIGLCRAGGGVTLIRIGSSDAESVAAWRWGADPGDGAAARSGVGRLVRGVARLVAGTLLSPGVVGRWRVVHVLGGAAGEPIPIRRTDLDGAEFRLDGTFGRLAVGLERWGGNRADALPWPVTEADAGTLLDRILVSINREGATPNTLRAALRYLEEHGAAPVGGLGDGPGETPAGVLRVRYEGEGAWRGEWRGDGASGFLPVPRHRTLALEMARHAEAERTALEGELRALDRRWREAEALARIADAL